MKMLLALLQAITFTALVVAVPPPRVAPAIRVELAANPGPMILEVYGGEFHRVDYRDTPNSMIVQMYWSSADWKDFTTFMTKNKLAAQGKVELKSDSAEGKQVIQYIQRHVIAPAAAKGNVEAAKKLLQLQQKLNDLNAR